MFIQHPLLKTKRTKMENWSRNFQTGIISDTCLDWFSSLTFCEWPLVIFIIFLKATVISLVMVLVSLIKERSNSPTISW